MIFEKKNYLTILAGALLLVIGYLLMIGGKSSDPLGFEPVEMFSFRIMTLSPIIIIIGFIVIGVGVLKRFNTDKKS